MKQRILAVALSLGLLGAAVPALAQNTNGNGLGSNIQHVLLISVDGLHALDVANYVAAHPNSALATLAGHGITYSNARTPSNSDSFPGLLALVTGGSPLSHGLFYDVSFNRSIFDPSNTSCQGQPGTQQIYDESIDKYVGNPPVSLNVIDPAAIATVYQRTGAMRPEISTQCHPHQHDFRGREGRGRRNRVG